MDEKRLALKEAESFSDWMRNTVKSIHYANHNGMSNAYNQIINEYLNKNEDESTNRRRSNASQISCS